MTDAVAAVWSDGGRREHNNHLTVYKPHVSDVDKWTRGGSEEGSSGWLCLNIQSWKVRNELSDGANQPKQMEPSSHLSLITSLLMPGPQRT